MERTLILIKPDGVQRGLVGEIIARFEKRGLKLIAAKFIQVDQKLAEKHYEVHKGKPFYNGLIQYITSAPVMAMVWEGPEAIKAARQTMGATAPTQAAPGSIRHDFALSVGRNLTHGSDSVENGEHEISLWFSKEEILDWDRMLEPWLTGNN